MTNLRIVRTNAEGALEVAFETGDVNSGPNLQTMRLGVIWEQLAEMRAQEPDAGWRLQTRGTQSDWHDYNPEGES